jgi:putative membrane protein
MSLAAERTYLAQLRTGLALVAAGVAVAGALPDAGAEVLRRVMGVVLVLLGGALVASARPRWKAVDQAVRTGQPLPPARVAAAVGWLLAGVSVAAAVMVLFV